MRTDSAFADPGRGCKINMVSFLVSSRSAPWCILLLRGEMKHDWIFRYNTGRVIAVALGILESI
jgi:hypothetical protein